MRQRGGSVVTCAGYEVSLIPATDYASERLQYIYDSSEKGYKSISFNNRNLVFIPDEKKYDELSKKVTCDASGRFKFENISDGTFFIITTVVWEANRFSGGYLMQKVSVRNNEDKNIIMTQ